MSNFNSIVDVIYKQNGGQPIVLNPTTVGHFQFSIGSAAAIATVPNPASFSDDIGLFPNRALNALPFVVRAAGLVQTGRGVPFQIDLNQSTNPTPTIATTGPYTTPLGTGLFQDNFLLEAYCMWDPTSTNLRGIQYGWLGANQISQTAILSGVQPASLAALQFNVAVTVLSANPGNQFTLTEFSIELI